MDSHFGKFVRTQSTDSFSGVLIVNFSIVWDLILFEKFGLVGLKNLGIFNKLALS